MNEQYFRLESDQANQERGRYGFPTFPKTEPQSFKCALCLEEDVADEGCYCPECQAEASEYYQNQMEDR